MAKMAREFFSSGVPDSEVKILVGWYKELADRARKMILNPAGGTANSQAFNRARAASLIKQLEEIAATIDKRAAQWIGKRIPEIYKEGRALADQLAIDAGVRPPGGPLGGSFNLVDSRSIAVLARDTLVDLRKATGGVVATARRVLRATAENGLTQAEINKILAGGVVEGRPIDTIRRLRDELIRVHKGKLVTITDKNGNPMQWDARDYAEMIVRTKTREAVVLAALERYEETGIGLVAVTGRVSNNFCTAFLNQVFSVDGKHPKYPPLSSLPGGPPPFHPNCSKSLRPFIEELATDKQLTAAEPSPDVGKLLGKDTAAAQRLYQDLQLRTQTTDRIKSVVPFKKREDA